MQHLPKPSDSLIGRFVTILILSRLFQSMPIIIFITNNHSHKFVWMEELQHPSTAHLQESRWKRSIMFLYRFVEYEVYIQINIFLPGSIPNKRRNFRRSNNYYLFSCVTGTSAPPGFNGIALTSPKTSLVISKVRSNTSCRSEPS